MFYAVKDRIENNKFFDGAQKPWGKPDRNSFNFARGPEPSRDIRVSNNTIEDLQLDFDHAKDVVVDRNVIRRGGKTAGIGIYTTGHNAIAENFQITNNTVIDPIGAGFNVGLDPPTDRQCIFRRITLNGNQVIRTKTVGYGVRLGTPNSAVPTRDNVFEDIAITNNRFRIENTAPKSLQSIFANSSDRAGIVFTGLTITGNTIENQTRNTDGFAIDLRRPQKSRVADNTVKGGTGGISLTGELLSNELSNNIVEASDVAYRLESSLGANKAANNRILGKPRQGWTLDNLQSSDSVEQ